MKLPYGQQLKLYKAVKAVRELSETAYQNESDPENKLTNALVYLDDILLDWMLARANKGEKQ